MAIMAWAFPLSTSTMTVGPTSTSPATARRAFCITIIATEPLLTSLSLRALPSTRTAGSREAWAPRSEIMTATADSTSSKPISPTTPAGLGLYTKYLGWGAMFFDFNNDSWPDLMLVNGHVYPEVDKFHLGSNYQEPRILYRNKGDGTFSDVSDAAGSGVTTLASSRGLAVGDLWNTGQLSAVISNMNATPSLLRNELKYDNHWIAFKTIGTKSNRDGIGARITVKAGKRLLVDEVRSGSSYYSQSDMRVHFGLGSVTKLDSVEIRWPSGLTERFDNVANDQINTVKEGTGVAIKAEPNGNK